MPRIDDYINARKLAVEKLSRASFEIIAERSGFEPSDGQSLQIPFLDRTYLVGFPLFEFTDQADSQKEVPIQEQVLILHYLMAAETPDLSGQWVSYREIPGASFYFGAFVKRAVDPLKRFSARIFPVLSGLPKNFRPEKLKTGMRVSNSECFRQCRCN